MIRRLQFCLNVKEPEVGKAVEIQLKRKSFVNSSFLTVYFSVNSTIKRSIFNVRIPNQSSKKMTPSKWRTNKQFGGFFLASERNCLVICCTSQGFAMNKEK